MAEEIRGIRVKITVETNKCTLGLERAIQDLSELDDLHEELAEKLGERFLGI